MNYEFVTTRNSGSIIIVAIILLKLGTYTFFQISRSGLEKEQNLKSVISVPVNIMNVLFRQNTVGCISFYLYIIFL